MKLTEYLLENEPVSAEIRAFDDPDAMTQTNEGKLACTPYRLVYVNGDGVTDISLKEVNSFEYSAPGYPKRYLAYGLGLLLFGLVLGTIGPLLAAEELITSSTMWIICGCIIFSGGITLVQGHSLRRSVLKIHTPNKSYEFYSKEHRLDEIGHTVRGYEIKN